MTPPHSLRGAELAELSFPGAQDARGRAWARQGRDWTIVSTAQGPKATPAEASPATARAPIRWDESGSYPLRLASQDPTVRLVMRKALDKSQLRDVLQNT